MHQFVYPVVFYKDKSEDNYIAMIPDLNLVTHGDTIEEAMLFAKDYLKVYCSAAIKFEDEVITPTKFETIQQRYNDGIVMLIDAIVDINAIKRLSR